VARSWHLPFITKRQWVRYIGLRYCINLCSCSFFCRKIIFSDLTLCSVRPRKSCTTDTYCKGKQSVKWKPDFERKTHVACGMLGFTDALAEVVLRIPLSLNLVHLLVFQENLKIWKLGLFPSWCGKGGKIWNSWFSHRTYTLILASHLNKETDPISETLFSGWTAARRTRSIRENSEEVKEVLVRDYAEIRPLGKKT
jgi:hypothetical protein